MLANSQSAMRVELYTRDGKSQFVQGEQIEYNVRADSDGYLYLLVFSSGNVATCIFANGADPDNKVSAGTFGIPRNTRYEFPVQPPFGADPHVAVLSKTRIALGEKDVYSWEAAIKAIDASKKSAATRGVGVRRPEDSSQAASILARVGCGASPVGMNDAEIIHNSGMTVSCGCGDQ